VLSVALNGGSLSDVLGAMIQGAVLGAFSGALFGEAAELTAQSRWLTQSAAYGAAGAISGGLSESAQGGNFWRGFSYGFLTASLTRASRAVNNIKGFDVT
jgi:hypothetical protein